MGSWMWRKMLKLRGVAKSFYMKELGNGRHTSFWFDKWSEKGVLSDLLGERGIIDLGVAKNATVEEALLVTSRRRSHRRGLLNDLEKELSTVASNLNAVNEDISLCKGKSRYRQKFMTSETWELLRVSKPQCTWARGIWFPQATPKFAFISWLAVLNRLSTLDRVAVWSQGVDTTCLLCQSATESRSHLFFECSYSGQVWEKMVKGILGNEFTNDWVGIVGLISDATREKKSLFCIRYALQAVLYAVWCERNKVKHGGKLMPLPILQKLVDKGIRNNISVLRMRGVRDMELLMQFWFQTRL